MIARCLVCVLAVLALCSASGQQTLNNDSVIKMSRMGFSEEAIVSQVNRSLGTYDTSAGGLAALKNAGVGDKVVTAMLNKGTAPEPPAGSAGANVAGPGTQTNPQALSNDSVIKISAMGFSDDVIARQVNHSPGSYDTSPAGLTALRNAGVGDKAISAMELKATVPVPPSAPTQTIPAPAQAVPTPARTASPSEVARPETASIHPSISTSASPAGRAASPQQNHDAAVRAASTQSRARVYVTDDPIFEHTGITRGSSAGQASVTPDGSASASSAGSIAGFSHTQSGADPRTVEIQADIFQSCPNAIVTINPQAANYVLTLRRRGGQRSSMFAFGGLSGLALSAGMKVDGAALFNRDGDMVYAVKERTVQNAVEKLCPYVIIPVPHL
jgi:hypothetical protein